MSASIRFMTNNLMSRSYGDGSILYSSQVASFEAVNLYDEKRWKEWLTSGCFEVYSANQLLYLNDGADKIATITAGVYASGTDVAGWIQAALNGVSSGWSVAYNTTLYRFTITHATATLRFSEVVNAAWDAFGYTGTSDAVATGGLISDEVRIHTSEFLHFDLISNSPAPKAVLMTGDADEEFDWQGASIRIRADNVTGDAAVWAGAALDVTITAETYGAYRFWDAAEETGYRYWRIDFIDRTNADGPRRAVNQMYLGPYFEPAEFNLNLGFSRTLVDPKTSVSSDSGSRYHRRRRKYWVYSGLVLDNIQDADREALERIALEIGSSTPFWIALDPSGAISKTVGEFTKYVEFENDISIDHVFWKRYRDSFSVAEVI